ncbi:hypothetical protein DFH29DRAFT_892261 [Suillus ampliporus]|nr:hypothetical protein DFH29DRAFT_892261 [Suillus ampliporus]
MNLLSWRNLLNSTPTPGSSRSPKTSVTQQSVGAAQAQSSSQPHAVISAPSSTPDHLSSSSTPRLGRTTSPLGRLTSLFPRSQFDDDVSPNISPRPWQDFFSRRVPRPRAAADFTELSDIILPPNTQATSQKQPKQQTKHSEPQHVIVTPPPNTQTTSQGQPQQVSNGLNQGGTPSSSIKQTGCCTHFWRRIWHCIRHCSCCCSCYESNEF